MATKPYLTEVLRERDATRRPGTPAEAPPPVDLSALAEFDPDAAEKLYRQARSEAEAAGVAADLPSLMSDAEIDGVAASRRNEHTSFARKERPDPWPIIAQRFPRIAETIRDQWGKYSLDDYFAKLVVDDRGGRQGFPPDVLVAILEVARLHGTRFGFAKPLCPWEADVSQMKWWSER